MSPDRADLVVAVDGPSGSGKSSVCRGVASRLGLRYLDTGAMYRALTWWALEKGVDLADEDAVGELARAMPIELSTDPEDPHVVVAGTPVDSAIREPRISEAVSAVATNLAVRAELVRRQRRFAAEGGVVIEGRDITTVVAPDAAVRVLLTAHETARLSRRALEVHGVADDRALASTRDSVVRRDSDDSSVASFQEAAEGVTVVDSSDLTLEQAIERVMDLVSEHEGAR